MLYAGIIGALTEYVQQHTQRAALAYNRRKAVFKFLRYRGVSPHLRAQVSRVVLQQADGAEDTVPDWESLMWDLSDRHLFADRYADVMAKTARDFVEAQPLQTLGELGLPVRLICSLLHRHVVAPGDHVIQRGVPIEFLNYVVRGHLVTSSDDRVVHMFTPHSAVEDNAEEADDIAVEHITANVLSAPHDPSRWLLLQEFMRGQKSATHVVAQDYCLVWTLARIDLLQFAKLYTSTLRPVERRFGVLEVCGIASMVEGTQVSANLSKVWCDMSWFLVCIFPPPSSSGPLFSLPVVNALSPTLCSAS